MDASRIIAERIGSLIDGKGKPQREQAAEIGISPQALSDYRNGNREPGLYAATRLTDYFGVSLDYLVGKHECKTPDNEQIHKVTGLTEGAIIALRNGLLMFHPAYGSGPRYTPIVNALLETEAGYNLLKEIFSYVYLNFNRAYNGDWQEEYMDTVGTENVEFDYNKPISGVRLKMQTSMLGDVLLLNIPQLLRSFRETVQAGDFGPLESEDDSFVDPEDSE